MTKYFLRTNKTCNRYNALVLRYKLLHNDIIKNLPSTSHRKTFPPLTNVLLTWFNTEKKLSKTGSDIGHDNFSNAVHWCVIRRDLESIIPCRGLIIIVYIYRVILSQTSLSVTTVRYRSSLCKNRYYYHCNC